VSDISLERLVESGPERYGSNFPPKTRDCHINGPRQISGAAFGYGWAAMTTVVEQAPGAPLWLKGVAAAIRNLPRGRYPAANWLGRSVRGQPFVAEYPGDSGISLRFWCDLRNSLAREVFFLGIYEPQETLLLPRLLGTGETFVDVGAHWGYFSLLAARRVGNDGRVVAIEADPRIFEILKRSLALNSWNGVDAVHVAASDQAGELLLHGYREAEDNWGISSVVGAQNGSSFKVAARPLDAILDDLGVGTVDLLKMDIEGAELLALRGAGRGLGTGRYQRILLELHPEHLRALGSSAAEVLRYLESFGYTSWAIDHSPATTRAVAYGRIRDPQQILHRLDSGRLDAWPHLVLSRGGAPPL
jgi:FkbM family methyltransferase